MDWTWLPPTVAVAGGIGVLFKLHRGVAAESRATLRRIEKKVDRINGTGRQHGEAIAAINARCEARHEADRFMKKTKQGARNEQTDY